MEYIERPGATEDTIILFHGYGADMHDLAPLSDVVTNADHYRWIFPNGPLQVEIGPHFYGRAWFPINIEEYQRAIQEGRSRDLSKRRPKGLDKALQEAGAFLKALNVRNENLILGGFSQGSMLTLELACSLPGLLKGVVLLSGNLLDEDNLKKIAGAKRGQRFFQSHGTHDPILVYEQAQRLNDLLTESGWQGDFHAFRGGHEIPSNVLQNLGYFLKS